MAAEELDGGALRQAVINACGDARVRAMLESADVTAVAADSRWEASHGAVQGYVVTVALCAEDLGLLDASPATRDLLEHGFAVAVGSAPDRAMTALSTRWNRRGAVRVESYRDIAHGSIEVSLEEALHRYRQTLEAGAVVPSDLFVEEVGVGVSVSSPAPLDARARQLIESALASLLGGKRNVRWSVR